MLCSGAAQMSSQPDEPQSGQTGSWGPSGAHPQRGPVAPSSPQGPFITGRPSPLGSTPCPLSSEPAAFLLCRAESEAVTMPRTQRRVGEYTNLREGSSDGACGCFHQLERLNHRPRLNQRRSGYTGVRSAPRLPPLGSPARRWGPSSLLSTWLRKGACFVVHFNEAFKNVA